MTDKPVKTLTIRRKPLTLKTPDATNEASTSEPTIKRPAKRIIKREELASKRVGTRPKATLPKAKPTNKRKKPVKKQQPKKPLVKPSDVRLDNINASLNNFAVWRECAPLALGIEKQIFQHIAALHLSASKRVVMRLLKQHTSQKAYLQRVAGGEQRYHLNGSVAGDILAGEKDYALSKLAGMMAV